MIALLSEGDRLTKFTGLLVSKRFSTLDTYDLKTKTTKNIWTGVTFECKAGNEIADLFRTVFHRSRIGCVADLDVEQNNGKNKAKASSKDTEGGETQITQAVSSQVSRHRQ